MIFAEPIEWGDAMRTLIEKNLLPTRLGSREIRERYDADLRARSIFSARTNHAGYLQTVKDKIGAALRGETNFATLRAELQDQLDRLNYQPNEDERGGLQDLSSDKRLNLFLETNVRQVANHGFIESGQSDFALFAYPALELVRIYPRRVPRGQRVGKDGVIEDDPGESWFERWERAGGELFAGRMVARKDADVWNHLGSSALFDDGLDQPHPPFAFNSGMGLREVSREDAIALGVIAPDADIQGSARSMNEGVEAAAEFDPEFLKALRADLAVAIEDGKAKISNSEPKPQALRNRVATLLHTLDGKAAKA